MGEELRRAANVVIALGDYEWAFDNALVAIKGPCVEIWYETEEGERRHMATGPVAATFIAWEGLEEFEHDDDHEYDFEIEE